MPDALTVRFQQQVARIGDRAGALVAHHWRELPGYDETDIPTFAKKAGPTLAAAKVSAVATGAAYYAARARLRVPPIAARHVTIDDPFYRDPFIAFWRALKAGVPGDEAVLSGTARASAMTFGYATSAARLVAPLVAARSNREVKFWIRIPDGDACDWCLEIADSEYASAEAADIGHDRCGCSIDPAY